MEIGNLSKNLLNKKVGFIRIEKPQKYRQNCEVAAWFTDYESDLGDYDIILKPDHLYPEQLSVHATVPATVTDNYHSPLFGGVPIGPSRSDKGQRGTIPIQFGWAEAAADRFRHNSSGLRFYVNRDYLDAAIEYAELKFRHYCNAFNNYYEKYKENPRNDYNSNIGMVQHHGQWISEWGKLLEEILRQKEYRFGNFACYYEKTQTPATQSPNT